ncbi:MAG: hypothetical protein SFV22_03035 [Saprospiraceae bacterium]|nr:hypothetical protein [Saprospiraceae bacterium]
MSHFNIHRSPLKCTDAPLPTAWVKAHLTGEDKYNLTVLAPSVLSPKTPKIKTGACAYARLSLMESGAVMAFFPVNSMVSDTIRRMFGATWFELEQPLILPAYVFGRDIEITAGRHPLAYVLENWVVMFRPSENQN